MHGARGGVVQHGAFAVAALRAPAAAHNPTEEPLLHRPGPFARRAAVTLSALGALALPGAAAAQGDSATVVAGPE